MAEIEQPLTIEQKLKELVFKKHEEQSDPFRYHLGASEIGHLCSRYLWLKFRWAIKQKHSGRNLKLFKRGQREEEIFSDELRSIGCIVNTINKATGKQFEFSSFGGHFGGSMDAHITNIPGCEKTHHVGEYKTHSEKSFKELIKKGVKEAKPEHYTQMCCYMGWSGMKRALYCAVNKNDDDLYYERIESDESEFNSALRKAEYILTSPDMPLKISDSPDYFLCKNFKCAAYDLCFGSDAGLTNCRTCIHSTPVIEGEGARWRCEKKNIIINNQAGCPEHLLIPSLIPFADAIEADEEWIKYKDKNSEKTFYNVTASGFPPADNSIGIFDSRTISEKGVEILSDTNILIEKIKEEFQGEEI